MTRNLFLGSAALRALLLGAATLAGTALAGCDDGNSNPPSGDGGVDGRVDGDVTDGEVPDGAVAECSPLEGDYTPGADDDWAACVSDDGEYAKIEATVSTEARIQAFDDMAELIFTPSADPSAVDFDDARDLYTIAEGLASRVGRRFDPHFPNPDSVDCGTADEETLAANADYCVGPAILNPIINDAFVAGQTEDDSEPARVYGARIEAALLWFLYASQYKESLTCTTTAKDCDSSWAYITGGGPTTKGGETGFAARVRALDAALADRIWNGALAVRCWRDLDSEATATDTALRDEARNQYDRASLDGVAVLVADALRKAKTATGDVKAYHVAFAQVLGRALALHMETEDETNWDTFWAVLADDTPTDGQLDEALEAIGQAFPVSCTLAE